MAPVLSPTFSMFTPDRCSIVSSTLASGVRSEKVMGCPPFTLPPALPITPACRGGGAPEAVGGPPPLPLPGPFANPRDGQRILVVGFTFAHVSAVEKQ